MSTLPALPVPDFTALTPGHEVSVVVVLGRKEEKTTRAGNKPYLRLELVNELGQRIGAKVWSEGMGQYADIAPGTPLEVRARVEPGFPVGEGPPELKILSFHRLPSTHPVTDQLNPQGPLSGPQLEAEFVRLLHGIQHPGIRRLVERTFHQPTPLFPEIADPYAEFFLCPGAKGNHHAYLHGLGEHTFEVTRLGLAMAHEGALRGTVNTDLLTAGLLLHDLGKIYEYVYRGVPIDMHEDVLLFNHLTTGPALVMLTYHVHQVELARLGVTPLMVKHIIHIQVSHHGTLEWGSPTPPGTLAAQIAHQADLTSARTRKFLTLLATAPVTARGVVQGPSFGDLRHGLRPEVPMAPRQDPDILMTPALGTLPAPVAPVATGVLLEDVETPTPVLPLLVVPPITPPEVAPPLPAPPVEAGLQVDLDLDAVPALVEPAALADAGALVGPRDPTPLLPTDGQAAVSAASGDVGPHQEGAPEWFQGARVHPGAASLLPPPAERAPDRVASRKPRKGR